PDVAGVALQGERQIAGEGVADLRRVVEAGRGEQLAVRTEADALDGLVTVPLDLEPLLLLDAIPHQHVPDLVADREGVAVRAEGEGVSPAVPGPKCFLAPLLVPEADRPVVT